MAKANLTAQRVREVLDYNPDTGVFTWRVRLKYSVPIGAQAGSFPANGYCLIGIDGTHYRAHRLAWLHVHGQWPRGFLDHIDGNKLNNAIANLREVCNRQNTENVRKPRSTNRTGLLGVMPCNGRYAAQIKIAGKSNYLGTFDTPEEAHAIYLYVKKRLHEGFVSEPHQ